MFKFGITILGLFLSISSAYAASSTSCYSRSYSANHMKSHKTQSLKSIKMQIHSTDGETEFVSISGVSSQGNLEYQFFGSLKVDDLICAEFAGDGNQDVGCVRIQNVDEKTISISPERASYNWGIGETWAPGLQLYRCEGFSSDGEGCMETFKTILLQPSNKQDLDYRLTKVNCH